MDLSELKVYAKAMDLGERVWELVRRWEQLSRDTVGKQLIRSTDSIAGNISEGFGRYHFKENRNHCYYARGSLFETKTWLQKAKQRNLIDQEEHQRLESELTEMAKMLNKYINSIGPSKPNDQ